MSETNPTTNNFMRNVLILSGIFAVVIIVVVAITAGGSNKNNVSAPSNVGNQPFVTNSIAVNGEGKVYATPDIFIFNVAVNETANTTREAFQMANTKVSEIRKALKDAGVAEKDVQTTNISMYPHYEYDGQKSVPQGYEANQTLTITVRKLEDSGKVMDAVTAVEGAQINSTQYDIDDKEKIYEEARELAYEKAEAKAKQLADLASVSLGKVSSISDVVMNYAPVPYYANTARAEMDMAVGMGGGPDSAQLAPGQMVFTLSVNVIYNID